MALFLDGQPIDDMPITAIVVGASNPARPVFAGGNADWADYDRNRNLLRVFGRRDKLDAIAAFEQYTSVVHGSSMTGRPHKPAFKALVCGELLAWATVNGLIERLAGPRWRLLEREPRWELCGPARRQRPTQIRGLTGADAIAAEITWNRELKRRERERVKHVTALAAGVRDMAMIVGQHAPETKLGEGVRQFAVGEIDTLPAAVELIVDAMLRMSIAEAQQIHEHVGNLCHPVQKSVAERRRAEREADEDAIAAALMPTYTPPSAPLLADVDEEADGTSVRYEIEGSIADVNAAIERIKSVYHPAGYGTRFAEPIEITAGRWMTSGSRSNNCD